jgi:hypothetical protein
LVPSIACFLVRTPKRRPVAAYRPDILGVASDTLADRGFRLLNP